MQLLPSYVLNLHIIIIIIIIIIIFCEEKVACYRFIYRGVELSKKER